MTTIDVPQTPYTVPARRPATRLLPRAAPRRRQHALPPAIARAMRERHMIAIRRGNAADQAALTLLAELSERAQPRWPLLVAEVDGELVAAMSVDGAAELRNPFRVTTDVIALLRLRAEQLRVAGP